MRVSFKILFLFLLTSLLQSCNSEKGVKISIAATTDVHGMIFSKNPASGNLRNSSMSKISGYLKSIDSESLVLLENGDNLQGTPTVYYYNFEDNKSDHLWARVLNYLEYDAITLGNHDLEAGHSVYDRIKKEYKAPILAANAINIKTGEPYFKPYRVLKKKGLKIVVFGLITPGVPGWLPEVLYEGIAFEDMVESARKWMPEILAMDPDLVIGTFHAGWNESYGGGELGSYMNENASLSVARDVPGFDLIFIGHDHDLMCDYITNVSGDSVLIVDGGSHARFLPVIEATVIGSGLNNTVRFKENIIKVDTLSPDMEFDKEFSDDYTDISEYINRRIGVLNRSISTRESYFGDSDFMDLIHRVQLETSGADISFAAPLSFNVEIDSGDLHVSAMFDLYRYENMLYTIELSGDEIDKYLEYSSSLWFNTISDGDKRILKYSGNEGFRLLNRSYNFDSAEGIDYIVDLSKPDGNKVDIIKLSDGRDFIPDSIYTVAVNSYRGSGGGGHLGRGVGLSSDEIKNRTLNSTDKDLRYYMLKWIEKNGSVNIEANQNWRLEPSNILNKTMADEYYELFKITSR